METKGRIVIIDDDPIIAKMIESAIQINSLPFRGSQEFRDAHLRQAPVGIFLDINLGKNDSGLDLIPEIRDLWTHVPLIVMTSESDDDNIGEALIRGANDFVKKPIRTKEILARFKARCIEMTEKASQDEINFDDVTINLRLGKVKCGSKAAHISNANIDLLAYLIKNGSAPVTRDDLRLKIWRDVKVSDSAVDKKIFEVRNTLKDLGSKLEIKSIYGEGVRLLSAQQPFFESA